MQELEYMYYNAMSQEVNIAQITAKNAYYDPAYQMLLSTFLFVFEQAQAWMFDHHVDIVSDFTYAINVMQDCKSIQTLDIIDTLQISIDRQHIITDKSTVQFLMLAMPATDCLYMLEHAVDQYKAQILKCAMHTSVKTKIYVLDAIVILMRSCMFRGIYKCL